MAENIYSKGTRVWFTDKEQGWISAEVTNVIKGSGDKIKLTFLDDRGKVSPRVLFFITDKHLTAPARTLVLGNRHRHYCQGYQRRSR
jgi:hypothetical protein